MKAVILQPMYLPWMGYFGLVDRADVFVFYDDVQFVRRSWQRRNKIKVPPGKFTWLTVPVEKDFGQRIDEVKIKDDGWREDHWKSIEHSYAATDHFGAYEHDFAEIYEKEWERLVDLNVEIIETVVDHLGIYDTEFLFSSSLPTEGKKTDRLLDILTEIEADEYISGPGAKDYLDVGRLGDAGVEVYWHDFDHPTYEQPHGEFVSHLSVIDLMFNVGNEALSVIREAEEGSLQQASTE